ncbi:MAG: delta-60 repeat domain-containing protein [Labilithrix sp.]
MSSLGRAAGHVLPLLLLAVAAGCSARPADEVSSATESNLDEGDTAPGDGPLAPDATFGTNGSLTLPGSVAISAARRTDGSIGVLGSKGPAAALTIISADGSAQAEVMLAPVALDGVVLSHEDGLLVAGVAKTDARGRYFVSRIGADGAVDATFTPDPLDLEPSAGAAAVTKDGKVLVAGRFSDHAAIVRLNANGSLDASFGDQGLWLASDDRATVTRLTLGADDSIYAVTTGADKTLLAHFSAAGKPDAKFGTKGLATLPNDAGPSALAFTKSGLRFVSASGVSAIDAQGAVTAGESVSGQVIGFGTSTGFVTAITEGDQCTVHVTEKATTNLTAGECASNVSYVALGGGKRALVSNTAEGVSVRVFGN